MQRYVLRSFEDKLMSALEKHGLAVILGFYIMGDRVFAEKLAREKSQCFTPLLNRLFSELADPIQSCNDERVRDFCKTILSSFLVLCCFTISFSIFFDFSSL